MSRKITVNFLRIEYVSTHKGVALFMDVEVSENLYQHLLLRDYSNINCIMAMDDLQQIVDDHNADAWSSRVIWVDLKEDN